MRDSDDDVSVFLFLFYSKPKPVFFFFCCCCCFKPNFIFLSFKLIGECSQIFLENPMPLPSPFYLGSGYEVLFSFLLKSL